MPDKIDVTMAEAEFARFAETWDLDVDASTMRDEDADNMESIKRRMLRHIARGTLRVEDDGTLEFDLAYPKMESLATLRFSVPGGDALLKWDRFKDQQSVHKINEFIGAMTGQPAAVFGKMDVRDLKVCQAVARLFLDS